MSLASLKSPTLSNDLNFAVEAHIQSVLDNKPTEADDIPRDDLKLDSGPSEQFAATIDHTLLKPEATVAQVEKLCEEAVKYGFKSVCVNPVHVYHAAQLIAKSKPTTSTTDLNIPVVCAVVGFPLGANKTASKAYEANIAVTDGAGEIDMVLSVGHLKARDYGHVLQDISAVIVAAGSGVKVKVIIETALLTDEEKVAACYVAAEAGASFVKTCTGFSGGAASVEDIRLMKKAVAHKKGKVQVKASAGIKTFEQCSALLKAGADRIGASAGVAIMEGSKGGSGY